MAMTTDTYLDAVASDILVWKPTQMRNISRLILLKMLSKHPELVFPDEIELVVEKKDSAVVGCAWRKLRATGLIFESWDARPRRSKRIASRGRRIYPYKLTDEKLVEQWLAKNPLVDIQPE